MKQSSDSVDGYHRRMGAGLCLDLAVRWDCNRLTSRKRQHLKSTNDPATSGVIRFRESSRKAILESNVEFVLPLFFRAGSDRNRKHPTTGGTTRTRAAAGVVDRAT